MYTCTYLHTGTSQARPSVKKPIFELPYRCQYVLYLITIVLALGMCLATLYLGYKLPVEIALRWLIALTIAFAASFFLLEPLKVGVVLLFKNGI